MVLYAKDIVKTDFLSTSAGTSVFDGARGMRDTRHGFSVIGTPDDPQGIVTEWDIITKIVAEGKDPRQITMGEIMTKELVSIEAGAPLSAVAQVMSEKGVRRLLVRDGNKVVGYITSKIMLARMNDYVDKISTQISRLQTPWI